MELVRDEWGPMRDEGGNLMKENGERKK